MQHIEISVDGCIMPFPVLEDRSCFLKWLRLFRLPAIATGIWPLLEGLEVLLDEPSSLQANTEEMRKRHVEAYCEQQKKVVKVFYILRNSVDPFYHSILDMHDNPTEVWKDLKMYNKVNMAEKRSELWVHFFDHISYDDFVCMQSYVQNLQECLVSMRDVGEEIDGEDLAMKLQEDLPEEFQPWIDTNIEQADAPLNPKELLMSLIDVSLKPVTKPASKPKKSGTKKRSNKTIQSKNKKSSKTHKATATSSMVSPQQRAKMLANASHDLDTSSDDVD